jgi:Ankyrin repeats (3 copies)
MLMKCRSVIADAWEYAHQHPTTAQARLSIWKSADLEEVTEAQQLPVLTKIVLKFVTLDLEAYLQASTSSIDDVDSYKRTALYWASSRGDETAVRFLLESGADVTIPEKTGLTALHIADSSAIVELLLRYGAQTECRDHWDRTALHWGCYQGKSVDVLTSLLDGGADVNAKRWNSSGYEETALHMAADFGREDLVACLLDHGASIDSCPHANSLTPLSTAIWRSKSKIVQILLQRGADVTLKSARDQTILHISASFSNIATIQVLTRAELRGLHTDTKDCDGHTAWEIFRLRDDQSRELTEAFQELLESVDESRLEDISDGLHNDDKSNEDGELKDANIAEKEADTDEILRITRECPGAFGE